DYCSGEIWMWQNNQQVLLQDTPRNIISFGEDEDGEIYVNSQQGQIDKIVRARASADFDGDLKTDVTVFRPNGSIWFTIASSSGVASFRQFGGHAEDIPAPEDYDGDNITDFGGFRPSIGDWIYLRSSDNTVADIHFGVTGDIPQAGDYDGDGKAD